MKISYSDDVLTLQAAREIIREHNKQRLESMAGKLLGIISFGLVAVSQVVFGDASIAVVMIPAGIYFFTKK